MGVQVCPLFFCLYLSNRVSGEKGDSPLLGFFSRFQYSKEGYPFSLCSFTTADPSLTRNVRGGFSRPPQLLQLAFQVTDRTLPTTTPHSLKTRDRSCFEWRSAVTTTSLPPICVSSHKGETHHLSLTRNMRQGVFPHNHVSSGGRR
jgi:hypothetical protein